MPATTVTGIGKGSIRFLEPEPITLNVASQTEMEHLKSEVTVLQSEVQELKGLVEKLAKLTRTAIIRQVE